MEKSQKMESDYEELYKWIETHTITRPKRNINRDFADAIPLVEILKQHFPKLVEMHNYSPKNSFAQKLANWEILNNKVLKKLKINLTKKRIESLAKAESGVIEKLLFEIKQKVESKSMGDNNCEIIYLEDAPSSASNKSKSLSANKKVVQKAVFEKMESDLAEKTEAINILKTKLDHLENLLNIKEERIKDLTNQLQTIVNQSSRSEVVQGSKFFGFFQTSPSLTETVKHE